MPGISTQVGEPHCLHPQDLGPAPTSSPIGEWIDHVVTLLCMPTKQQEHQHTSECVQNLLDVIFTSQRTLARISQLLLYVKRIQGVL